MKKRFEGGRINEITILEDNIQKKYLSGGIVNGLGLTAFERWNNEARALMLYDNEPLLPLRVPKLLKKNKHTPNIVMEYIFSATSAEKRAVRDPSFFTENKAQTLADILHKIHSNVLQIGDNVARSVYADRTKTFIDKCSQILWSENIDIRELKKYMSNELARLPYNGPVVSIHADFWLENILIDDEDRFYVIDWEFFSMGNPYEDLGVFYTNVEQYFPNLKEFCNTFFHSYDSKIDLKLVRAFSTYRCLRLLSNISIDAYDNEPFEHPHSFKELAGIIRKNMSRDNN